MIEDWFDPYGEPESLPEDDRPWWPPTAEEEFDVESS